MSTLQALTTAQPWPRMFLLDDGPKDTENRTWPTPPGLVGKPLALHGGRLPKSKADFVQVREALTWVNDMVWDGEEDPESWLDDDQVLNLCVSGIFAIVTLQPSVATLDSPWFVGPHGWVWSEFTPIEPVPCKGAQGLWKVEGEVLEQVRAAYRAAKARPAAQEPASAPAEPAQAFTPAPAAAPALFRPGLAVTDPPRRPEPGRLYGLAVGEDWVTFVVDRAGNWSWCSRLRADTGAGSRSAFQSWLAQLAQERAA